MRAACVLVAVLAAAAAAPDTEDLPPVDTVVDQLLRGELTPEDVATMVARVPPEYARDIKHNLPEDLTARIAAIIHAQATASPEPQPEPETEPADGEEEPAGYEYDDDYYWEEGETTENPPEPAPEPVEDEEPAREPVEDEEPFAEAAKEPMEESHGEPAEYKDDAEASQPRLRMGEGLVGEDIGGGGGGGGGTEDGGVVPAPVPGRPVTDATAIGILRKYADLESGVCKGLSTHLYTYYTIDQTSGPAKVEAEIEYQKVWRVLAANASKLDLSGLDRTDLLEKFMLIKHAGVSALSDAELRQLDSARNTLETRFANNKANDYFDEEKNDLRLAQDIRVKLAASTNADELHHYWVFWRDTLSRNMQRTYNTYVQALNTAARKHDADSDAWQLLMYPYKRSNTDDLLETLEKVWDQQLSPVYEQLHTYARYHLRQRYGALVPEEGPIPAHLFGSLEADDWTALEPIMRPVKNASSVDFHRNCAEKSLDIGSLKKRAKSLYTELGLNDTYIADYAESRLNVASGDSVMFLPPRVIDRCYTPLSSRRSVVVAVYPTNSTLSDYIELVELLGELQAYNQRARPLGDGLDFVYRDRDSFRDYGLDRAIGGERALSAMTPNGLHTMFGFPLLDSEEEVQNLQMALVLKLMPRLAASMAALRWQADVLTGRVTERNYNSAWWEYKEKYQGVSPPQDRDESDFDAFADGTITLTNHHIRRLIGGVAMFSVHKFMCRMYGPQTSPPTPLAQCSLLNQKEVGHKISEVLIAGNSKPFRDQLSALTGETELTGKALVEQLQPITEWMVEFNKRTDPNARGNTQTVAIIVGVVIAVIILGLVIFFVVARRRQRYQDYKGAPSQEMKAAPQQA